MKLSTVLWSGWAAAAAASGEADSPYGTIYVSNDLLAKRPISVPTLSPPDARLYLAQRLGLSEFHDLSDASDAAITLLNNDKNTQASLLTASRDHSRRTLILVDSTVAGVDDLCGAPEACIKVAHLSETPSSQSNIDFVNELLSLEKQRRKPTKQCRLGGRGILPESERLAGGTIGPQMHDLCHAGLSFPETALSDHLREGIEDTLSAALGTTGAGGISGDIVDIYFVDGGRDDVSSDGIKAMMDGMKEIVGGIATDELRDRSFTLVVLPARAIRKSNLFDHAWDRKQLNKRQSGEEASSLPQHLSTPVFGRRENISRPTKPLSKYFGSEKDCISKTFNCTGHGICKSMLGRKSGSKRDDDDSAPNNEELWFCSCKATNGTQNWAGPGCQKKDISTEFWLFALFSIAAVSVVTMGIGMLYNMGEQDLPSVLSAGVAPTKK